MTEETLNTRLTLSAAPALRPEDARSAAVIEHELARVAEGADPDRLIDYVWRDVITLDRDGRIAAQEAWIAAARARQTACDPDAMSESELRLLDGNR